MTDTKQSGVVPIDEAKKKADLIKELTLPEQGPFLPLPDEQGNRIEIGRFDRWDLKREKELGELRKQNSEANLAEWVAILLGELSSTIGSFDFKKMNPAERQLSISQMVMPDVLYAYVWLRYVTLGPELKIRLECPFHDYKFTWTGDLRTLKIRVPATFDDLFWNLELRNPITIRDKKVDGWRCGPARWTVIEKSGIGRRVNQGQLKATMIHGTIRSIGDAEIALADHELDGLTKLDLERHLAEIERNSLGPDFTIEARCDHPKCDREFITSLDWSYDSFFAVSSL